MSAFLLAFAHLVGNFADLLQPLFHGGATAAAIVIFTALVRLAVHPLSRASARGQKARTKLAPQVAELRKKHAKNPERMQKAIMELHAAEKVSPLSGCLPSLLQLPAFFVLYHLFSKHSIGGVRNGLLSHSLFAAPLGGRWFDVFTHGGVFGGAGLVYVGLFAVVAAVATFNYGRVKQQMAKNPMAAATGGPQMAGMGAMNKLMPLMSFATLISVAVVPLAAGLYLVTSTTWTAVERYFLYYREKPEAAKKTKDVPAADVVADRADEAPVAGSSASVSMRKGQAGEGRLARTPAATVPVARKEAAKREAAKKTAARRAGTKRPAAKTPPAKTPPEKSDRSTAAAVPAQTGERTPRARAGRSRV
jgi:YidC/Oxa1 family membrane protein insertase